MTDTVDLAVIGAGPAGMAAALEAERLGLSVALIDEQPAPGGQIWRGVERAQAAETLGADYLAGREDAARLRASGVRYRPATTLWHLDPEGELSLAHGGRIAQEPLRLDCLNRRSSRRQVDPAPAAPGA